MSLNPALDNIVLRTGASYTDAITCRDAEGAVVPLTGCNALLRARNAAGDLVLELGSPSNGLVIDAPAGVINRTVTAARTVELQAGEYACDLLLTWPDGRVDCLLSGPLIVIETATQPTTATP